MDLTCNAAALGVPDIAPFGLTLFEAASSALADTTESNILLSPLCIAMALALALAGATPSSRCESQLLSVLGIQNHVEIPKISSLLLSSNGNDEKTGGVSLTLANSIWTKSSIKPEYKSLASDPHNAAAFTLPENYEDVDEWISQKTKGLVSDMVRGPVDPLTVALLVNAVHFKGSWKTKFDENKTEGGDFATAKGTKQPARFMRAERKMDVALNVPHLGGATVLRLDYDNGGNGNSKQVDKDRGEYCALFILPKDSSAKSMQGVVDGLRATPLSQTLSKLRRDDVDLWLPRFRVSWGMKSLKEYLRTMGIADAFDGKNIFSVMTDDPDVHIDDILHKAVMEVTEEGTVAAAAAVVEVKTRSLVIPPEPLLVAFDRPFIMLVLHAPSGTPLFVGRLDEPQLEF